MPEQLWFTGILNHLFASPVTLVRFTGNRLAGNAGHQLGFADRPSGGENWTLGTASCDSLTVNRIDCYAPGQVGILISSALPTLVQVRGTAWQNLSPALSTDWTRAGSAANAVVLVDPPCPPVTTCP